MNISEFSWTQEQAISFCRDLEKFAPSFGAHIALTGGCLYSDGERKDVDIVVYRIRQYSKLDMEGFLLMFENKGGRVHKDNGFCVKASWANKPIDFFFPERLLSEYPSDCGDYQ